MKPPRRLLLLLSALFPLLAQALGLGNPSGQAVIGQPLSIRIPLSGPETTKLKPECIRLLADDSDIADPVIKSAVLKLSNGAVLIEGRQPVTQPLLSFRVMIDCGTPVARTYQLLPLQPVADSKPPITSAISAAPQAEPAARLPAKPQSDNNFTVAKPSTLRLISRQRYPGSSRARVGFIRSVAAANPEIFPSLEDAYDQPLPAGQALRLPNNLPPPETTSPPKQATPGKGKLVISSGPSLDQTVDELGSDLTRLTTAMNDQILIQTSLFEKIKALETEFATAKRSATEQQAISQRMETELRELRAQQQRNSLIQLALVILLLGVAGFNGLHWLQKRKGDSPLTTI